MSKPPENVVADILTFLVMFALIGVGLVLAITPALLIAKWLGAWP